MTDSFSSFDSLTSTTYLPSFQEENIPPDTEEWIENDKESWQGSTSSENFGKMIIEQEELKHDEDFEENVLPSDETIQEKDGFESEKVSFFLLPEIKDFMEKWGYPSDDPIKYLCDLSLQSGDMEHHHLILTHFLTSHIWIGYVHNYPLNLFQMKWFFEIFCLFLFEERIRYISLNLLITALNLLSRKPFIFWEHPETVLAVRVRLLPIFRAFSNREILGSFLKFI